MSYISYYSKLFKTLRICDDSIHVSEIIINNRDFYIDYYVKHHNLQTKTSTTQPYYFDNHNFTIIENIKPEPAFSIHWNDTHAEPTCILLLIQQHRVYIDYISHVNDCLEATTGMPRTKGGSLLLKMAIDFITAILAPKYGLKYIWLYDNSFIEGHITRSKLHFDFFYMVTHGYSWMGKYGFVPFDTVNEITDAATLEKYEECKKLVTSVLVENTDIYKYIKNAMEWLPMRTHNSSRHRASPGDCYMCRSDWIAEWCSLCDSFHVENGMCCRVRRKLLLKKLYAFYANKTVQQFMKHFHKKYDRNCHISEDVLSRLISDFNMRNVYGYMVKRAMWRPIVVPL